jgi:hypothetical protein
MSQYSLVSRMGDYVLGRRSSVGKQWGITALKASQFLTFSGILMFLVVGAIIFLAFKLLPPYINNYQMQDFLASMTRNATYNRTSEEDLRKQVMNQARQLNIPIEPRQIQIEQTGNTVSIAMQYSITVDFLVRPGKLELAPSAGTAISWPNSRRRCPRTILPMRVIIRRQESDLRRPSSGSRWE